MFSATGGMFPRGGANFQDLFAFFRLIDGILTRDLARKLDRELFDIKHGVDSRWGQV